MSRSCRIRTRDDVVFGFLVFRLRGTIDPSHDFQKGLGCKNDITSPGAGWDCRSADETLSLGSATLWVGSWLAIRIERDEF